MSFSDKGTKDDRIRDLHENYGVCVHDAKELVDYEQKLEQEFSVKCQEFKTILRERLQDDRRLKLAEIIGR